MPDVEKSVYPGSGTVDDPFIVNFVEGDTENAKNFATWRKWAYLNFCWSLVCLQKYWDPAT